MKHTLALLALVSFVLAQCPDDSYCFMNGDKLIATLRIIPHACQESWTYELHSPVDNGLSFIIAQDLVPANPTVYSRAFGKQNDLVYYVTFHGVYMQAGTRAGFSSAELKIPSISRVPFTGPAYSVSVPSCKSVEDIYTTCSTQINPATSFTIDPSHFDLLTNYDPEVGVSLSGYACVEIEDPRLDSDYYNGRAAPLFCPTVEFNSCSPDKEFYMVTGAGITIEPMRISFDSTVPNPEQCVPLTDQFSLCIKVYRTYWTPEVWGDAYYYVTLDYYAMIRDRTTGLDISIGGGFGLYNYLPVCGMWDCFVETSEILDPQEHEYVEEWMDQYVSSNHQSSFFVTSFTTWTSTTSSDDFSSFISSLISSIFGTTDVTSEVSSFVSSVEDNIKEEEEHFPLLPYLFVIGAALACVSANVALVIVIALVVYRKKTQAVPSTYNAVTENML